jgi:hypothetical protein
MVYAAQAKNYVQQKVQTLASWIYFLWHFKPHGDENHHYTVEELQTEFQYSGNAIGTDTLQ